MQDYSETYSAIHSGDHWSETRILVYDGSTLAVTLGENSLRSAKTYSSLYSGETPEVGACVAGEIDVSLYATDENAGAVAGLAIAGISIVGGTAVSASQIPKMAKLIPQVRICNETQQSEWLNKGVYFIDTRELTQTEPKTLSIHGYDAMLFAEQDFPSYESVEDWGSMTDADVINLIAAKMGVGVDSRTWDIVTDGYLVGFPMAYSLREVLGYIGAMYAGNWIMSDDGELRLVALNGIPGETNLLLANGEDYLVFADGTRILINRV
jgi:hypothetical protein